MMSLRTTIVQMWRIAIPYFRSDDRKAGRILLAAVIAIELALVAIDVLVNQWRGRFYNALQERDWTSFTTEMIVFSALAGASVVLAIYQLYLNQWLQIRWRRWLTERYLGEWLDGPNHYRIQLQGDVADNPDQRVTEDVRLFVERTLAIGIGLLSSVVTLASFVWILWSLSAAAPLTVFGVPYDIPGYLVWAALIYAVIGTGLTHWIGSPLAALNFRKQAVEADFRFDLVRVRENGEQIALLKGESAERERLGQRFARVTENWMQIMSCTKRVTAFTASYSQASVIFPYILTAPAYFANVMQLGGMMQTASAFGSVQSALSFFVTSYRDIAEWQSIVVRLSGFEAALALGRAIGQDSRLVREAKVADDAIELHDVRVDLPKGRLLVTADAMLFARGQATLVSGPSGSGKSSLFRAIAGVWPFGAGRIDVPAGARLMLLPQRPYFPVGQLRAALAYPSPPDAFDDAMLGAALDAVALPSLRNRLTESAHWNLTLSLGEQQRLALARALLQAPDFLFLDEATASLDEPTEARLYALLKERLPETTIVSIGHRSTLDTLHDRKVALVPAEEGFVVKGAAG